MSMEIVILAGTLLGLVGVSFFLGEWLAMTCRGIGGDQRKNLKEYEKWGLDKRVYLWPFSDGKDGGTYVFPAVSFAAGAIGFGVLLFYATELTGATKLDAIIFILVFLIACPGVSGFIIRMTLLGDLNKKVKALKSLMGDNLEANRVLELISMYDALRIAPPIFWETYAKSHAKSHKGGSVTKNDQEFQELVAPYYHSQPNRHTRLVFTVSLVALGIGIASLFWETYAKSHKDGPGAKTDQEFRELITPYYHSQPNQHTRLVFIVSLVTLAVGVASLAIMQLMD